VSRLVTVISRGCFCRSHDTDPGAWTHLQLGAKKGPRAAASWALLGDSIPHMTYQRRAD